MALSVGQSLQTKGPVASSKEYFVSAVHSSQTPKSVNASPSMHSLKLTCKSKTMLSSLPKLSKNSLLAGRLSSIPSVLKMILYFYPGEAVNLRSETIKTPLTEVY